MGPKKEVKKYDLNDKVMCKHGLFYYEAKITEIAEQDGEPVYVVHYQGWHKRYDERITQAETADKFLAFTPENVARCKKEIQEAQSSKIKRRKTKEGHDDDGRKSDAGSRASTPNSVPRSASVSTPLRTKIAKKRAEAGTDTPAATSTTSTSEPENKSPVRERDPVLLQELDKLNDMPSCLLQIIVDDSDIMTRQRMVSRLPARYTVDTIINDYCAELGFSSKEGDDSAVADSPSGLGSSAIGLRDFFNGVLGYQLLYKFERPQYAAEIEKAVGSTEAVHRKRKSQSSPDEIGNALIPSKLYGLPHLLRLIVRLTTLLRDVPWNDNVFRDIIKCTQHLIGFLEKNHQKYYSIENDYENTTPEYQKTAWASTS
uniref:MRG domain-containing protein n=1 Tax=Haemonchus contortus TaxID=6289 RepID=A0A7I4YZK4_HAECO